jgi:c(7)-type cytochrome triheme protein
MKFFQLSPAGLITAIALVIMPQWNSYAIEKDGGFITYPCASGPVVFSHRSHGIQEAGYACNKCHLSAEAKTMSVRMDDIRQGQTCGSCHDGRTKGPRRQLIAASIDDCRSCHMPATDIIIKLNRMDPVAFSHIRHLAVDPQNRSANPAGFACSDCHPAPFDRALRGPIGMEVPHKKGGCAQCHNGKRRKDGMRSAFAADTRCLQCHKPPE